MQGRIIKGIAGFYYVETADGKLYECRAKGIFRNQGVKPLVGDYVDIDIVSSEKLTGNVINIYDRKNELLRPPVANVDQALILFAIVHPNPSYNLLDRFLIMMKQQNLPVIICFNKQDIADSGEIQELQNTYSGCGYDVHFISVREEKGIDEVKDILRGKTTVLAGPSGVGKSSLINLLHPKANMETGELSKKIERGKNTTRHSELFRVENLSSDTYLMDTPGFTSLYMKNVDKTTLSLYYSEFEDFANECRFSGCAHISEPNCMVKEAVKNGEIPKIRYENYKVLYEELKDAAPIYKKKRR